MALISVFTPKNVNICVIKRQFKIRVFIIKMESLNIIQLIEKNSITRLSKDYENRLINKIKDNFDMNQ